MKAADTGLMFWGDGPAKAGAFVCLLLLCGCGQVLLEPFDGGPDTMVEEDAGPDAQDAGPDAQDAGPDAQDAGPDAPDAGPDAQDAGPDAQDAGTDVGVDAFDVTARATAVYFVDEAESGQGPSMLVDSASDPVHLRLTYQGASPTFNLGGTGRFLTFAGAMGDFTGGGLARIDGTKLDLHGSQAGMLEVVFRFDSCAGTAHQRAIGIGSGNGSTDGWFTIRTYEESLSAHASFASGPSWTSVLVNAAGDRCPVTTKSVVHFVVDTTEAVSVSTSMAIGSALS